MISVSINSDSDSDNESNNHNNTHNRNVTNTNSHKKKQKNICSENSNSCMEAILPLNDVLLVVHRNCLVCFIFAQFRLVL